MTNEAISGNFFYRPIKWVGRSCKREFSPLPPEGKCKEILYRIVLPILVAVAVIPSALFAISGLVVSLFSLCCTAKKDVVDNRPTVEETPEVYKKPTFNRTDYFNKRTLEKDNPELSSIKHSDKTSDTSSSEEEEEIITPPKTEKERKLKAKGSTRDDPAEPKTPTPISAPSGCRGPGQYYAHLTNTLLEEKKVFLETTLNQQLRSVLFNPPKNEEELVDVRCQISASIYAFNRTWLNWQARVHPEHKNDQYQQKRFKGDNIAISMDEELAFKKQFEARINRIQVSTHVCTTVASFKKKEKTEESVKAMFQTIQDFCETKGIDLKIGFMQLHQALMEETTEELNHEAKNGDPKLLRTVMTAYLLNNPTVFGDNAETIRDAFPLHVEKIIAQYRPIWLSEAGQSCIVVLMEQDSGKALFGKINELIDPKSEVMRTLLAEDPKVKSQDLLEAIYFAMIPEDFAKNQKERDGCLKEFLIAFAEGEVDNQDIDFANLMRVILLTDTKKENFFEITEELDWMNNNLGTRNKLDQYHNHKVMAILKYSALCAKDCIEQLNFNEEAHRIAHQKFKNANAQIAYKLRTDPAKLEIEMKTTTPEEVQAFQAALNNPNG